MNALLEYTINIPSCISKTCSDVPRMHAHCLHRELSADIILRRLTPDVRPTARLQQHWRSSRRDREGYTNRTLEFEIMTQRGIAQIGLFSNFSEIRRAPSGFGRALEDNI